VSELDEFYESQRRFAGLSINEQICHLTWFLHQVLKRDRFSARDVADQFRALHLNPPQLSVYLSRLAEKKPPLVLWDRRGYFLEGRERKRLNDLLNPSASTVVVSKLLLDLTESIQDGPEKVFLDEAIRCYRVAAFRAAIVMTWNLAYDHLRRWLMCNPDRLEAFNLGSKKRFTKSPKSEIYKIEDFEDYKESEFIDACSSGKVISKNLETMLREKLKRRNMAAHPSMITILQPQADDVISDLVRNVLLELK
jgi:hypothetical protein